MSEALAILQKYWKHDTFRSPQDEIIQSILDGKDTFGLMPTGGGKSICFQVPALMKDGICLVISPLVALMKDQVHRLQQLNIKAIALTWRHPIGRNDCPFGQLRVRQLQIPVLVARASAIGLDFGTNKKSAHQIDCRGRSALCIAMGTRFSPGLPENCQG